MLTVPEAHVCVCHMDVRLPKAVTSPTVHYSGGLAQCMLLLTAYAQKDKHPAGGRHLQWFVDTVQLVNCHTAHVATYLEYALALQGNDRGGARYSAIQLEA